MLISILLWTIAIATMSSVSSLFTANRVFITRLHMRVNRTACCWLIRRFINPEATIMFVPAETVAEEQAKHGAIGFDAPGATYPHEDDLGRCSFKAMIHDTPSFANDPVLMEMGDIIQAADMKGQVANHPAAYGLQLISQGFPETSGMDDLMTIEKSRYVYDSLYNSIKQAAVNKATCSK